ncbi:MAG TPA: hypothetical protein VHZ31_05065 [Solirubrobacteraceae bacterium]|nr:hypothetical protein [Solirubrobacteraceae bacterium]
MAERLAGRFASAGDAAIEVDGQLVHMLYELDPMQTPTRLSINLTSASRRPQGLRLKARGGTIAVDGRRLDDIVLWTDTAPALSTAVLVPSDRSVPLTLRVWNVWRDPAATMQAWIGDAGIIVDGQSPERVVLRCSDGFDAPMFDDLVVELALSVVTTNHAVTASGGLSFEVRDEIEHARDRLARVLSRMDGKSSYSIVLWKLPPGKRLDEVDEGVRRFVVAHAPVNRRRGRSGCRSESLASACVPAPRSVRASSCADRRPPPRSPSRQPCLRCAESVTGSHRSPACSSAAACR